MHRLTNVPAQRRDGVKIRRKPSAVIYLFVAFTNHFSLSLGISTDSGIILRRRGDVEDLDRMWQGRELCMLKRVLHPTVQAMR